MACKHLSTIGCRKKSKYLQIKGKNSHLPHQLFPNPTPYASLQIAWPVYRPAKKIWDRKKKDVRVEKIGGTKSSSHFLLCFGHLSVIYQNDNYSSKFPCVWCVSEKYTRFMLHPWRLTAETCPHGGLVQIILPFFSCMMAVGSSVNLPGRIWITQKINSLGYKTYCWWRKSCTTWDGKNSINNGIIIILGGAGFCPSTVSPWHWLSFLTSFHMLFSWMVFKGEFPVGGRKSFRDWSLV